MPKSHKGLVLKEVEVKRGGKTFTQRRWVKAGEDNEIEKPSKKEEVKGKKLFKVGSKLSFMDKNLTVEKVSESEKTVKLSDGKIYTFDAINKGSKVKKEKVNVNDLTQRMDLYKSGIKFHPDGKDMINSVSDYTDVDYVSINSYLRDEKSGDEKIDKNVDHITNFLKYAPKMDGTVYRGMSFGNDERGFDKFLDGCIEGKSIMMKSFTSTSTDKDVVGEFKKGDHSITIEIKSKNGVYLDGLAEVPEENEVLFDKKSKFNILKINKSNPKHVQIIMEEM